MDKQNRDQFDKNVIAFSELVCNSDDFFRQYFSTKNMSYIIASLNGLLKVHKNVSLAIGNLYNNMSSISWEEQDPKQKLEDRQNLASYMSVANLIGSKYNLLLSIRDERNKLRDDKNKEILTKREEK